LNSFQEKECVESLMCPAGSCYRKCK
jgi:hypothetical protein